MTLREQIAIVEKMKKFEEKIEPFKSNKAVGPMIQNYYQQKDNSLTSASNGMFGDGKKISDVMYNYSMSHFFQKDAIVSLVSQINFRIDHGHLEEEKATNSTTNNIQINAPVSQLATGNISNNQESKSDNDTFDKVKKWVLGIIAIASAAIGFYYKVYDHKEPAKPTPITIPEKVTEPSYPGKVDLPKIYNEK